jgi:RND family efflux transporter MFP subunit
MYMKSRILLYLGLCTLLLTGCDKNNMNSNDPRVVRIDTAISSTGSKEVIYPGRLKAMTDINVAFRVVGTIQSVPVTIGQYVSKGHTIAQLDSRDYNTQFSATEAEYSQIKADATRVMELYKRGSATASENDKATYGLRQITAKYNAHKNALADTRLVAPCNGYIQKMLFEPGETVGAGMPVISMISNESPEIEINITAADYLRMNDAQSINATIDALPGKQFPLQLIGITHKANLNQLYTARFKLTNTQNQLITAGMAVNVTITFASKATDLITVPLSAILKSNDGSMVWVYNNGKVNNRRVTVKELTSDGRAVITSGLSANELVVSAGTCSLKENEPVKPLQTASSTNIGGVK